MTSEGSVGGGPASSRLTPRARILLPLGLIVLAGLTVQRLLTPAPPPIHELGGATMGTTYSVKLWGPDLPPASVAALADTVAGRLDEVDRLMSTYDTASELSVFNRRQDTSAMAISPLTFEVLSTAQRISVASGGAFDVTVGPLVEAWGFGPQGRAPSPPSIETLEQAALVVGYDLVRLDSSMVSAAKRHAGVRVDLSAIAKGFGVDRVAAALTQAGLSGYLVEVGGELRAAGEKPDGSPWRVGIERPTPGRRVMHQAIALKDLAVATSGDYRNFYELDGRRFAHLIDPVTMAPVVHAGVSVSVLHPSCMVADAWATALSVLGPERGPGLAQQAGIAALFVWQTADTAFRSHPTDAFTALTGTTPSTSRSP